MTAVSIFLIGLAGAVVGFLLCIAAFCLIINRKW